jgi:hypothetical protein
MRKLAVATFVIVFLFGGAAWADIPDGGGYAHACYLKRGFNGLPKGSLRVFDSDTVPAGHCRANEIELWLSATHPLVSDRAAKKSFRSVDDKAILAALSKLPVSSWTYKEDANNVRHIGPMAQDFYKLFAVGADNKHIDPIAANGIALAGIKGLDATVRTQQREIFALGIALIAALAGLVFAELRRRRV